MRLSCDRTTDYSRGRSIGSVFRRFLNRAKCSRQERTSHDRKHRWRDILGTEKILTGFRAAPDAPVTCSFQRPNEPNERDAKLAFYTHGRHRSIVTPEPHDRLQPHSRREFLLKSSALAAALAANVPSLGAADQPASAVATPPLLLPPLLARPTETSIRISALNGDQPVEAAVELRREDANDWQRLPLASKVAARHLLDWDVKDLSPATKYDYRVLLKQGADETFPGDRRRQLSHTTERPGELHRRSDHGFALWLFSAEQQTRSHARSGREKTCARQR